MFYFRITTHTRDLHSFPTRRSSDLAGMRKTTDRNAFRFYYNEAKRLERQIDRLERGITGSRIGATIQGWRSDLAGSLPGAHLMRNPLVLSTAADRKSVVQVQRVGVGG